MKAKLLTMLIVLLLIGGTLAYMQSLTPKNVQQAPAAQTSTQALQPFPDVTFATPDDKPLSISTLHEPVILVHFWAAWCAVCFTEFPDLLKYVANSHGKIALLSVSLDDNYADSQKALTKMAVKNHLSLQAPHLYWAWDKDKKLSLKIFNTVKVPETIIVNDKGQMMDKIIGLGPWNEASSPQ